MGFRLYLLTLTLLMMALQSPAQRHGRRHEPHVKHSNNSLPDSVSTSDEEIKPFNDANSSSSGTVSSDTIQSVAPPAEDSSTNTDTTAEETTETVPVLRSVPDSSVRNWKKSHDFDYANDPNLWKKEPVEEDNWLQRFFDGAVFRWLIYILLGGVLLYALYKIISENNLRFFYRKPVRLKDTAPAEAELPVEDLDQLLQLAVGGKDYRMATRYLYLKTLRHLDALEWIRWHGQATDEEYVRQMNARPQGERFRWLTSAYERVWYGKFSLEDHQYTRLSQYFREFQNDVGHPQHS
ncbi:MAG TPA: DUF4129 domain-containing protein [Puia sp.]|jgi:hypothetical protein